MSNQKRWDMCWLMKIRICLYKWPLPRCFSSQSKRFDSLFFSIQNSVLAGRGNTLPRCAGLVPFSKSQDHWMRVVISLLFMFPICILEWSSSTPHQAFHGPLSNGSTGMVVNRQQDIPGSRNMYVYKEFTKCLIHIYCESTFLSPFSALHKWRLGAGR